MERPSPATLDRLALNLDARLGDERVVRDRDVLEAYCTDWSGSPPAWPDLLVRARSSEEVSQVLSAAHEARVPVIPRGLGSGKSGGALATQGGLILSLEQHVGVEEVHVGDMVCVARAGTTLQGVYDAVEAEGLFYGPDPSSAHLCTIGGNVACNAGGPRALKYGVTKQHVLGMDIVAPATGAMQLGGRGIKQSTGFDMTGLMVGSEGLLGVITRVTLRLLPEPRGRRTLLAGFADVERASEAVTQLFRAGAWPRACELLDETATRAAMAAHPDWQPGGKAALIVEADGLTQEAADQALDRLAEVLDHRALHLAVADTRPQRDRMWAPRYMLSETLRATAPRKVSEDVTVPRSRIPELMRGLREVGAKVGVRVAAYGHAGDGNLHVNVLFEPDQTEASRTALFEVGRLAVGLGGTLSGEHGIGALKRDLLPLEQSPELIELQRRIKAQFDPRGILNPGKVLPERSS
ncbi:MAG: FAD-linked oxidase C-terminal domain-containing protein [Myxococcota bacterium]